MRRGVRVLASRTLGRAAGGLALVGLVLGGLAVVAAPVGAVAPAAPSAGALAGKVIVIDPGHQLGNSNPRFSKQMSQTRFNGSIVKGCNTTGTATNSGLPEATFNWKVANRLRRILEFANDAHADAMISIHADGAVSSGHGFHVIAPTSIKGWTTDVVAVDRKLARAMIAGMKKAGAQPSTYLSSPLSIRGDQSTINFSDVPTVIVELGNMRNRGDAAQMVSRAGQGQYAAQLASGLAAYFG
jgi:N-acetylmuramoyl-L-alanine amidase